MKQTQYQLVVTDLDGTLVPYCTERLSERTIRTVAALREKGLGFTIATGRSWVQAKSIATRLKVTLPVIVQAGAVVLDPVSGRLLRSCPLRPELEYRLRRLGHAQDMVDQFCLAESGRYYTTRIGTSAGEWLYRCGEKCSLVEAWQHRPTEIIKHLFIGPEPSLRQIGRAIKSQITPEPRLILWPPDPEQQSVDWFLEVFDPLASKGQALQWLTGHLQLGMEAVIAFGDGGNDLDMLELAGMGVAIEGGAPEIMAVTAYRAGRPEADGLARFLSLLLAGTDPDGAADDGVA
jgi:Cof subfamily protein (haloacid dehalogenase superfamily)